MNHITNTLAFDPGIRYLFAAGGGGNAWIVPLDGTAPRKLEGYSADIGLRGAAVSPSGRRVASARFFGQGENTLCIWEVESGDRRCFELPESQTSHASAMEMSTRGAETSRTTLERAIQSLAFAGESTLYTAGDGGLRRWDLETGAHELVIAASPGYLLAGDLAVDAGIALTAELPLDTSRVDECRQALLTDLATGASRRVTELGECHTWGLGRQGRPVAIDESGTVAATGSVDGIVRVGRLGEEPHLLVGHRGAIASVAISPDLRWVATSGEDNTLRLWPMPDLSKPPLHTLPYDELLAKLKSLTNLRVVEDPSAPNGYSVDVGPFPGWAEVPEW